MRPQILLSVENAFSMFNSLYSEIYKVGLPLGAEIFGIGGMMLSSPAFWICLVLVPIATLLPDLVVKV